MIMNGILPIACLTLLASCVLAVPYGAPEFDNDDGPQDLGTNDLMHILKRAPIKSAAFARALRNAPNHIKREHCAFCVKNAHLCNPIQACYGTDFMI